LLTLAIDLFPGVLKIDPVAINGSRRKAIHDVSGHGIRQGTSASNEQALIKAAAGEASRMSHGVSVMSFLAPC